MRNKLFDIMFIQEFAHLNAKSTLSHMDGLLFGILS